MSTSDENAKVYGLFAQFDEPEKLLNAAVQARKKGYQRLEAYSPYPIEDLGLAIGFKKDRVALVTLIGGFIFGVLGFFMQWYANVIDYPINLGGRPDNSWPAFIPITFELAILGAALSAAASMLILNRLPRLHHPAFNHPDFFRVSKDRFFLCIKADDPNFDPRETKHFLLGLWPIAVNEICDED